MIAMIAYQMMLMTKTTIMMKILMTETTTMMLMIMLMKI